MQTYDTNLSNLSYTNKDFSQIYPELLDLAKKISYKWDPSQSDESDPGVVLLKLAAIVADKCNYNIDKNILELFPTSVTQLSNARELFDQCGYCMKHYNSATTTITLGMDDEPDISDTDASNLTSGSVATAEELHADEKNKYRIYTIPQYTMITTEEEDYVYTLLEQVSLNSDGTRCHVSAIEGRYTKLEVNGTFDITSEMLDSNNRIYLSGLNIPENGVFITSVNSSELWTAVENLHIQKLGSKVYKFGVSKDGTRCFVEFPSDIAHIIGNGLNISYVLSSGSAGNLGVRQLKKFFGDLTVKRNVVNNDPQDVKLSSENVYISNTVAATGGKDPETIDEAYDNYQKIKTTFNTLVSTKDYSNFFRSNGVFSNCVVCDKSNDIQSAYNILELKDGVEQLTSIPVTYDKQVTVRTDELTTVSGYISSDEMTEFDLRVYGLEYVDSVSQPADFTRCFNVVDMSYPEKRLEASDNVKTILHNYLPFVKDRIVLIKNKYPIHAKIVSSQVLSATDSKTILDNIRLSLFKLLNSKNLEFGAGIDYNSVYNAILSSDPRISAVALSDIQYSSYAVYVDSDGKLKNLRIDAKSTPPTEDTEKKLYDKFRADVYAKSILAGVTPLFVPDNVFNCSLSQENLTDKPTYDVNSMSTSLTIEFENSNVDTSQPGSSYISPVLKENECITLTSPSLKTLRTYSTYVQYITNVGLEKDGEHPNYTTGMRPIDDIAIRKDQEYVLKEHEYIVFFWRGDDEDDNAPYTYVKYTGRNTEDPVILCPSFTMYKQPNSSNISASYVKINDDFFLKLGDAGKIHSDGKKLTVSGQYPDLMKEVDDSFKAEPTDLNAVIQKYIIGENFNVKTRQIEVKGINKIHLNNSQNGSTKFYWILNDVTIVKDASGMEYDVYRLFGENDKSYTLKQGELLIYTDVNSTTLYTLGNGTVIERNSVGSESKKAWDVRAIKNNKLEFLSEGPRYFERDDSDYKWFGSDNNSATELQRWELHATEMLIRKLTQGTRVQVHLDSNFDYQPQLAIKDGDIYLHHNGQRIENFGADQLAQTSYTLHDTLGNLEDLPYRNSPVLAWQVSCAYNLNMSPDNPQRLYSNQKIIFKPFSSNTAEITIEGSDYDEVFIQSSSILNIEGGTNLDVRTYNMVEETFEPTTIYVYQLRSNGSTAQATTWTFDADTATGTGEAVELDNIQLPEGRYILPVTVDKMRAGCSCSIKLQSMHTLNSFVPFNNFGTVDNWDEEWSSKNAPSTLSDFVSWLYGIKDISTSKTFKTYTIPDIFRMLFDEPQEEAKYGIRSKETVSAEGDAFKQMLVTHTHSRQVTDESGITKDENVDVNIYYQSTSNNDDCRAISYFFNLENLQMHCGDIVLVHTSNLDYVLVCLASGSNSDWAVLTIGGSIKDASKRFQVLSLSDFNDYAFSDGTGNGNTYSDGDYLFILRPSAAIDKTATDDGTAVSNVIDVKPYNKNEIDSNQTYYCIVEINDTKIYSLKLSSDCSETVYTFDRLRRVLYPELASDIKQDLTTISCASDTTQGNNLFESIVAKLTELDVTEKFDISREIDGRTLVSYPLESRSFLDPNHVFNRATISQYIPSDIHSKDQHIVVLSKAR